MDAKRKRDRITSLLLLCGAVFAISMFLYPFILDAFANIHQTTVIDSYADDVDQMDDGTREACRKEAEAYNAEVYEKQKKSMFEDFGDANGDEKYRTVLNPGGDGVMAYLSIPEINVDLPVGHGTDAQTLSYEVGHMYGTSVPIGGESTHAVLSAHTGLESAKLFTDLDQVKEGSVFYLHVLGEVHKYEVDKIRVVLPEEANQYLKVEEGKDLVTLYTCTPYGINTHRLLVRGHRVPYDASKESEGGQAAIAGLDLLAAAKAIALLAIPIAIAVIGLVKIFRNKKQTDPSKTREIKM